MSFASTILGLSPAFYARLNETTGTAAADTSTNANAGTYKNSPTLGEAGLVLSDEADKSVKFTAASKQYVSFPHIAAYNVGDTFSIVAVVKVGTTGLETNAILGKDANGPYLRQNGNRWRLLKTNAANICTSTTNLVVGTTYMVVVTKTGATVKIYQGEVKSGGTTLSDVTGTVTNATIENTTSPLTVARSSEIEEYAESTISEVALFPTALSKENAEALLKAAIEAEAASAIHRMTLLGVGV